MGERQQSREAAGEDGRVHSVEFTQTLTPTVAVLEAVADAMDEDPAAMSDVYDVIDTDALNAMLTGAEDGSPVRVSFEYAGYDVTISSSGDVLVTPRR
ncbi:MAG: HalOD1 output domain-containing protein [Halanaeroarchaeum sp.]